MSTYINNAEYFAKEMDAKYTVFGISFGYDVLLSLIPLVGPLISFCISLYLLTITYHLNISFKRKYRSMWAIGTFLFFDAVLGSIPIIGIVIDVFFKANIWSVQILKADELKLTMPRSLFK